MASVLIYDTPDEVNQAMADHIQKLSAAAIKERGIFTIALSGGRTPPSLFAKLISGPSLYRIDWGKFHLFQVDERFVPADHPDNNFLMIKSSFIEPLSNLHDKGEVSAHAINTHLWDADSSALDYQRRIQAFFFGFPVFDLILLGIGEDGHTASLFPGSGALEEKGKLVVGVEADQKNIGHSRITLTYPVINGARNIAFLAIGSKKAPVIAGIINDRDERYPATRVESRGGGSDFFPGPGSIERVAHTRGKLKILDHV